MTNPTKYKVLPGGTTCKKVNPHTKKRKVWKKPAKMGGSCYESVRNEAYYDFEANNPVLSLTEPMEEGTEFFGVEVEQYKSWDDEETWITDTIDGCNEANKLYECETRIAIQPIKEEKEVPKELPPIEFDGNLLNPDNYDSEGNPIIQCKVNCGCVDERTCLSPALPLQAVDANKEQAQPFEAFPKLADCLLHGAHFWKTDNRWSETLEEINKICTLYSELEQMTDKVEDLQILLDAERQAKPSVESIVGFVLEAAKYGYEYHANSQFPEQSFEDNCKNNVLQWLSNKGFTTSN